VGPRFAGFTPAAQAELLGVFTEFTVASYVANFDDYNGERFTVETETRPVGTDQVVRTRMIPTSGDPVKLDYVVRQEDDAWRIVDVLLNGTISRVAVQRSDFRSLLESGDPGPLIASLKSKIARLAAGGTD
jgi:phospholipid transport system substrate-binding protein